MTIKVNLISNLCLYRSCNTQNLFDPKGIDLLGEIGKLRDSRITDSKLRFPKICISQHMSPSRNLSLKQTRNHKRLNLFRHCIDYLN